VKTAQYFNDDDGRYHCPVKKCNESFELPQHLGMHMRKHMTPEEREERAVANRAKRKPSKKRATILTAESICDTVLASITNGTIPVASLGAYKAWVEATRAFMETLQ
jgi:hypothetical protein